MYDPRRSLAESIAADRITAADAADVARWLDTLEPRLAPVAPVFVHNDIHPWNVMVDPATSELVAIIDWGNAGTGDPALELIGMPLAALPAMLDGYRAEGGTVDPGMTARLVWGGLALALWELRELDARIFDRRYWRMSPGGWAEHRARTAALFPELEA
jgi:aminoglycoside phosphotransferase (APT) family kinase protein